MSTYAPGTGTGFTSIADYLDANQGTLANEQAAVTGDVNGQIGDARSAADKTIAGIQAADNPSPDYTTADGYGDALGAIHKAQESATNLGTYGGVSDLLGQHYGKGAGYSRTASNFDATLLGPQSGDYSKQAQSLTDYLNQGAAKAAYRPPPVVPDPETPAVAADPVPAERPSYDDQLTPGALDRPTTDRPVIRTNNPYRNSPILGGNVRPKNYRAGAGQEY